MVTNSIRTQIFENTRQFEAFIFQKITISFELKWCDILPMGILPVTVLKDYIYVILPTKFTAFCVITSLEKVNCLWVHGQILMNLQLFGKSEISIRFAHGQFLRVREYVTQIIKRRKNASRINIARMYAQFSSNKLSLLFFTTRKR